MREEIIDFLKNGTIEEVPNWKPIKNATLKYPYFQGLLFFYLKFLYTHDEVAFQPELRRLAPFISDRKALFYSIFSEEYTLFFQQTGKKELSEDRTAILLDAFFSQEPKQQETNQGELDENLLNAGIVSNDYFSYLEQTDKEKDHSKEEKESAFQKQDIIDNFIEKSDNGEDFKVKFKPGDAEKKSGPVLGDDSLNDSMFFTETLAQIYIKQKKYEKAYKIITQLNLNFPEKNSYFADQIRFLEKLMINSSKKKDR